MISLDLVTPANAMIFKEVRLRALQDTPSAFSANYAEESQLTDADWTQRAVQWNGRISRAYIAMDADTPCGIAGGYLEKEDSSRAHLVSMWVAPSHRRLGIGCQLIDAVVAWACAQGARTLQLTVTSNNDRAIEVYRRLGFTLTRNTGPYRNDPALSNLEMIRLLVA
jgi:ribosomal protein S18 acetylase RimI-like enzyme